MTTSQSEINVAQKKEFFDSVYEQRIHFRKKNSYYHQLVINYLKFLIPPNASVLDIGCFAGDQLANLNPSRGVGVEFCSKSIEFAQKNYPKYDFHVNEMDDLNLNETFDYVVINNVIGYTNNLQKTFKTIRKACKPETKVVLVYHSHLWRPFLKLAENLGMRMKWPEQHWLAKKDLLNLFHLEGFKVIRSAQQVLFPFKIPILSPFFNKYLVHVPFFRNLALNHLLIVEPDVVRKEGDKKSVSVIVPCRNEKGNIEQAVTRTAKMGRHTEIIFVEGHSSDGTLEECERVKEKYSDHDIKVFAQKGKGKGDAVRLGFSKATGDILMILDADLTVPPEDLPSFYEAIVSGKGEFINGSRLVYRMEEDAMRFLNMLANKTFSIVLTHLLGQYLKDTLCGTKVLWKEDYKKIEEGRSYFGDFDPFGDFDLLFGAAKLNLKIVEIPVQYRARSYGETQISRFRHGWLLIKMTIFAAWKIKYI
jgi:SAM-dependent methyltransferase